MIKQWQNCSWNHHQQKCMWHIKQCRRHIEVFAFPLIYSQQKYSLEAKFLGFWWLTHVCQKQFVIKIFKRTFPQISWDWKADFANVFAFWMYAYDHFVLVKSSASKNNFPTRNLEHLLATIFQPQNAYCIHIDPKVSFKTQTTDVIFTVK